MTTEPSSPDGRVRATVPVQVRAAGALVALQGGVAVAFAIVLVIRTGAAALPISAVLGEAGLFVVLGLGVLGVGFGLLTGRRWARTPAIVTQLLLLPVVYSLIGPSRQLVLGIVAGAWVIAAFLLLISERSRIWSVTEEFPPGP